jgi:hypothetical protein
MHKRNNPLVLVILTLLIATLACSLGGKKDVPLGETFKSDVGGFSLQKVPEFEFEESFGLVIMMPSDAQQDVGPFIMAYGGLIEENKSTQDILEQMKSQAEFAQFSDPKTTKVDGKEGLLVEFSGEEGGQMLKGKLFTVTPFPMQEFYITGLAPEELWKDLDPIYEAVLNSVTFFEAQPFVFGAEDWEWDEPTEEVGELPDEDLGIIEDVDVPMVTGQVIRQWAVRAEASSEYSPTDYSAMQAAGAPDVDACGENPLAWASVSADTEEYLILHYETPVNPTELVIYQTNNPSQVVEIQLFDTTGESWLLWYGDPQELTHCPDVWTHTVELDEVFYTNKVVLWLDQSVLGLGWAEIDAVELVGYPMGGVAAAPAQEVPAAPAPPAQPPAGNVPTNYSGLMAGPVYQGWINIVIGETMEADLDRIMTIPGRKSTDSWKPRESHKQTYLYDLPWSGMTGYISVTQDGWVYKMNVSSNVQADDFVLSTVTWDNYEKLKAIYDRDKVIPYDVMANMLESPGFLREQYYREEDGMLVSTYSWYNAAGDRISGIFFNGRLTGIAGLAYIKAE